MSSALVLVLVVALAYLATHVASDWLAKRFLIVSGAEYLILGILLGPQVSGMLSRQALENFGPLATLAVGWIGVVVGIRFVLPEMVRIPGALYRVAFAETFLTFAVVVGLELIAVAWLFEMPWREAIVPAVAFGALASTSASGGIGVVASRLGERTPIIAQLEVSVMVNGLVAITVLSLLSAIFHPELAVSPRSPTATEWMVISIAIGVVGGVLFHLFIGPEREVDRPFIALAGAVILVSGAAGYLGLSPLLPAMLMGAILVNTSRAKEEISEVLIRAERPFYFVLLILAGASWTPSSSPRAWVIPVVLFLAARMLGKLGGARLAARANDALPTLGPDWGRALLGHGGLALALALDYMRGPHAVLHDVVFTAAIASVLLTDLASARMVQSVVAPVVLHGGGKPVAAP